MVYSQSESNAKEVFLFQGIEVDKKSEISHLKAVCFLRPTAANISALLAHLRAPRFAEYHIYFTNILPKAFLKQIAEADEQEVVRTVQEYFSDFYAVNSDLFTLNIPQTRLLCAPHWGAPQNATFARIVDGLASTLLAFKKTPVIRYLASSDLCRRVATELASRTKEENGLFDFPRSDGEPLLLLLDRRMDPVTPLLMQWTYQALVHELLGLHNHRVDLSGAKDAQKEFKEVVLSPEADHFFKGVMFQNWGDVASQVHELLQTYARQNKDNRKMQSFDEMKDFVENYPQFKQLQTNACKHMTVASELHRKIDARRLLEVSELEQELAGTDAHSDSVERLLALINDSRFADEDKLRCALLYALRYETVRNEMSTIQVRNWGQWLLC
jgi:vacuolar protein sorting-associated protein 45